MDTESARRESGASDKAHTSGDSAKSAKEYDEQSQGPGLRGLGEQDTGDLQFKKQDFRKLRTQLLQLVLSTASLKLLKQQYTAPLHRNSSGVGGVGVGAGPGGAGAGAHQLLATQALRNFQLFIQAPVLLLATNLRGDKVEIGQQLPFSHTLPAEPPAPEPEEPDDGDDVYKEETILQQQRLTLNALKKLSLSLAPIIQTEDEPDSLEHKLTTRLLNNLFRASAEPPSRREPRDPKSRGFQPAMVDLLAFSSLTRQSKHVPSPGAAGSGNDPVPVTQPSQQNQDRLGVRPEGKNGQAPSSITSQMKHRVQLAPNIPRQVPIKEEPLASAEPDASTEAPRAKPDRLSHAPSGINLNFSKEERKDFDRIQQIKGYRSPMYVPAVLRRTAGDEEAPSELVLLNDSIRSVELSFSVQLGASAPNPFRRLTPTRRHWLKDEQVSECGILACRKKFSFFERRHHCRRCGGIFCKEHTLHHLYISPLAQFTTGGRGTLSRVCDNCIGEYNEFMRHEFGVSLPPAQKRADVDYRREVFRKNTDDKEQLVGSVPANWSWSSF